MSEMLTWKVEAQGDTVYVQGETIDEAERKFENFVGGIPKKLLTWTKVNAMTREQSSDVRKVLAEHEYRPNAFCRCRCAKPVLHSWEQWIEHVAPLLITGNPSPTGSAAEVKGTSR